MADSRGPCPEPSELLDEIRERLDQLADLCEQRAANTGRLARLLEDLEVSR